MSATTTIAADATVADTEQDVEPSLSEVIDNRTKRSRTTKDDDHHDNNGTTTKECHTNSNDYDKKMMLDNNPLYKKQYEFLQSLTEKERTEFFSSSTITPIRRAEIWMEQSQIGIECINQYAWVTPDVRCMRILQYFAPIIEIGCGSNAYWCQQLLQFDSTIDIVGYDISPVSGGKIITDDDGNEDDHIHEKNDSGTCNNTATAENIENIKDKTIESNSTSSSKHRTFFVQKGGPEVLAMECNHHRTLFLCYPDEDVDHDNHKEEKETRNSDDEDVDVDDDDEEQEEPYSTMAMDCLKYYTGDYIIHVGELMSITTPILGSDKAPYGRTSSISFQERLYSEYHCILQCTLQQHWLHTTQDCITVWKRSTDITTIVYGGNDDEHNEGNNNDDDDDDESDDEVQYRHIPIEERLPTDIAAPIVQHLLWYNL
jgi:hypothetical protein